MKKIKKLHLTIVLSALLLIFADQEPSSVLAQNTLQNDVQNFCTEIVDNYSNVTKGFPQLLISEISINSDNDYLKIFIPPQALPINLNGWQLQDDKVFFTFPDQLIEDQTEILIENTETDESDFSMNHQFTKTSENLNLITPNKTISDAICWQNQTPTQDEKTDLNELLQTKAWTGNCLDSETIEKDFIIKRINSFDTNTDSDWNIINPELDLDSNPLSPLIAEILLSNKDQILATPATLNFSASTKNSAEITNYSWLLNDEEISTEQEPDPITLTTPGSYILTLTINDIYNRQSSHSITLLVTGENSSPPDEDPVSSSEKQMWPHFVIKSALPNPIGSDTNNEIITLFYSGTESLTIENWQLDDEEGGSKPFTIPTQTLEPNSELVINNQESKISLNNDEDTVRLFNPDGDINSELAYKSSKEGEPIEASQNNIEELPNQQVSQKTSGTTKSLVKSKTYLPDTNPTIAITELLPNPKSADKGLEWLEVQNLTSTAKSLQNWQLLINDKSYRIELENPIQPKSYVQIKSTNPSLNLPNSEAKIQLINPDQKSSSNISYTKAPEEQSYSKISNKWQWTKITTPGKQNPEMLNLIGKFRVDLSLLVENKIKVYNQQQSYLIEYQTAQLKSEQIEQLKEIKAEEQVQLNLTLLKLSNNYQLISVKELSIADNKSSLSWTLIIFLLFSGFVFCTIFYLKFKNPLLYERLKSSLISHLKSQKIKQT